MKRFLITAAVCSMSLAGFLTPAANAASLGLVPGLPDIKATLGLSYNAGTDTFSAVGGPDFFAVETDGDMFQEFTILGQYTLTASISSAGALVGGNFNITGVLLDEMGGLVAGPAPLLFGNLTGFGFTDTLGAGSDVFEFTFDVAFNHPSLASFGSKGGIIMTTLPGTSTFTDSFNTSFSASVADSDTFAIAVPTPGAAAGGFALLAAVGALRMGRRNRGV